MKLKSKLTCALVLALFAFAVASEKAVVTDVLKDSAKFDGKIITLTGKVSQFKLKTSKVGNKYFTFEIGEKSKTINVYGKGELDKEVKDGAEVEVTGKYYDERDMKTFTVKHELDVTKGKEKEEKENGVKLIEKK